MTTLSERNTDLDYKLCDILDICMDTLDNISLLEVEVMRALIN